MSIKKPIVLFFGYPLDSPSVGGLIWTKKIADYVESSKLFIVKKIKNDIIIDKKDFLFLLRYLIDALNAFFTQSDIVILNFYGEANQILWFLLRIFKPKTKVLVVCHHYQERNAKYTNHLLPKFFESLYNYLINKITIKMMNNADRILTDSVSSASHIKSIFTNRKLKIDVVGVGIDFLPIENFRKYKDIDFICIGRFDKFKDLEKIWQIIKQKKPETNFIMCGHGRIEDIKKICKLGVEHKGIIKDFEKVDLYSRAKVLLYPTKIEGFGIVVAEALQYGLSVITWEIPVFEELYSDHFMNNLKLIEQGNYQLFANEAISALKICQDQRFNYKLEEFKRINSWDIVGKRVISILLDK